MRTEVKSRIAILVCSNLVLQNMQACNKFDMTRVQHVNVSFEVTTRRSKPVTSNSLQTIAKTEYEHNLRLELATYRLLTFRSKPLGQLDSERRR
ncbi:hypothetical protein AVEN_206550-1 [Araneus ventricosus]|uniref:Uncharacterized protein n=1 Tax=Araneus ventricosus TaxID=182803 RepID=A0A4Y2VLL0_ARAVE|nr:hypothetical protein AVEN_206550-1 [Araneus ventricosus]